jgi:hypothetical protein
MPRNAVVVKQVSSDNYEIRLKIGGFFAELVERSKSGLSNPIASLLLKSSDSQTQVKVSGMKKTDQVTTSLTH